MRRRCVDPFRAQSLLTVYLDEDLAKPTDGRAFEGFFRAWQFPRSDLRGDKIAARQTHLLDQARPARLDR